MSTSIGPEAWAIISVLFGALVGFLASLFYLPKEGDKKGLGNVGRLLPATLFGALFGAATVQTTQVYLLLHRLQKPNAYEKADQWTLSQRGSVRELFRESLNDTDIRQQSLARGEISLSTGEVLNYWQRCFELTEAGSEVLATNIVSLPQWREFAPEGDGKRVQEAAIKRGVRIRRIMLYDPRDREHEAGLDSLSWAHMEVGVSVKKLDSDWLELPQFSAFLEQLITKDFVIFGDNLLLLTFVDPSTKKIKTGMVYTDHDKINLARRFFERLWSEAQTMDLSHMRVK